MSMDLPQPESGQHPNIELIWAGDSTGHLNVSLLIGTVFGVSNVFSNFVAREVVSCDELCECDIHEDTGDLLVTFHVEREDWQDFARAMIRKVYQYVAARPGEWNQREAPGPHGISRHDQMAAALPSRKH